MKRNDLDSTLELPTEIVVLKEECAYQSSETQTNKSRTPRLLAYTFPTIHDIKGVFLWDFKGKDESLPIVDSSVFLLDHDLGRGGGVLWEFLGGDVPLGPWSP